MRFTRDLSRLLRCSAPALLAVASSLAAPATAVPERKPVAAHGARCTAWDIDYKLQGKLKLSQTPLGAGDGIYEVGPGAVTLRFQNVQGKPSGAVQMTSYRMREHYTVSMRALLTLTSLTIRADTRVVLEECAVVAEGSLNDSNLEWPVPVRGYRTDGKVTCVGFLCGKPGVPSAGTTDLHIAPALVQFEAFEFSKDRKTLTMDYSFVSSLRKPKQSIHLALQGSEVRRRCITPPSCP